MAEEEEELLSLFKRDFESNSLPGQKRIEEIIRMSRQIDGGNPSSEEWYDHQEEA